jgi:tetratricopeptide (TPR) repeat protein
MKPEQQHRNAVFVAGLTAAVVVVTLAMTSACNKTDNPAPAPTARAELGSQPDVAAQNDTPAAPAAPAHAAERNEIAAPEGIPAPDLSDAEPKVADLIRTARSSVVAEPASAEAWGYFGQVCHAHFLNQVAERCYTKAHELAPAEFKWAYLLAIVRKQTDAELDRLVDDLRAASELDPDYAPALYHLGETLARAGRQDEAQRAYERAIEADENLALAHRGLGQVLLGKDEAEKAVTHLQSAVGLQPRDGAAKTLLAQAFNRVGDRERAEIAAKQGAAQTPIHEPPDPVLEEVDKLSVSAATATQRGRMRMASGDFRGAIAELEKVVELLPDDAESRVDLATAYLNSRRVDEAIEQCRKAVELRPELAASYVKLGWALRVNGELEEAASVFRQGLEVAPDDFRFYAGLGVVLTATGDYEGAVAAGRRAVALAPDQGDVHNILGKALMESGSLVEAEAEFVETLKLIPNHPEARWRLGEIRREVQPIDAVVEPMEEGPAPPVDDAPPP